MHVLTICPIYDYFICFVQHQPSLPINHFQIPAGTAPRANILCLFGIIPIDSSLLILLSLQLLLPLSFLRLQPRNRLLMCC